MAINKHVQEAESKRNGIIFHSNTFKGIGVKTYFNEKNEICSITAPISILRAIELSELQDEFDIPEKKIRITLSVVIIMLGILSASLNGFFLSLFIVLFALPILITFFRVWYIYKRKTSCFHTVSMFHSAEHMVINAYNKFQRIPTFEEVRNSSRISKHCGSNIMFLKLIYGVALCTLYGFFGSSGTLLYPIGLGILLFFCFLCNKYQIHSGMQHLILSTPTDDQLLLAIEGVKNFEKMEEAFEKEGIKSIFKDLAKNLPAMLDCTAEITIETIPDTEE